MSVIDGKMGQSARMYFKQKDHKDAYFDSKFHGVMMYSDDNSELHGVYWRKMFQDRYVIFRSNGNSQNGGRFIMCYPKEKEVIGEVFSTYQGDFAFNGDCICYNSNYWAEKLNISSHDGRITQNTNVSIPIRQWRNFSAMKSGMLIEDYNSNDFYFMTFKESEDINNPCYEVDDCVKVFTASNARVYSHTFSDYALVYHRVNGVYVFSIFDAINGTFEQQMTVPNGFNILRNNNVDYANGKFFVFAFNSSKQTVILEITDEITSRIAPAITDSPSGCAIKYNNGRYYYIVYWWEGVWGPGHIKEFTSMDLSSWTEIPIPSTLTVNSLAGGTETFDTMNVLRAGGISDRIRFYKNNEVEENPDCIFAYMSVGNDNQDGLNVYFDNLTFDVNDNCFAFRTSWVKNNYRPMGMWEHYYNMEVENNGVQQTNMV